MDDDKKKLAAALADIEDLKKTVGELSNGNKARKSEIELAGPYVASSPTADGTIDFMIAGKRYRVLVDAL